MAAVPRVDHHALHLEAQLLGQRQLACWPFASFVRRLFASGRRPRRWGRGPPGRRAGAPAARRWARPRLLEHLVRLAVRGRLVHRRATRGARRACTGSSPEPFKRASGEAARRMASASDSAAAGSVISGLRPRAGGGASASASSSARATFFGALSSALRAFFAPASFARAGAASSTSGARAGAGTSAPAPSGGPPACASCRTSGRPRRPGAPRAARAPPRSSWRSASSFASDSAASSASRCFGQPSSSLR